MTKRIGFIFALSIIGMPPLSVSRACAQTIFTRSVRTVNVDTPLDGTYDIVRANGGPSGIQITLPLVATGSNNFRQHFTIKKVDNTPGPVTIVPSPLDPAATNIDGQSSFSLVDLNQEVRVASDGTNWNILSAVPKNVVNADTFPGADAGRKIAAAIGSCPLTGCVVDARGLQGAQTISETITLGLPNGGGKPVQLLLGAATFTTTETGSTTDSASLRAQSMIVLGTDADTVLGSSIMGAHFAGNSQVDYAVEFHRASYPAVVYNDFRGLFLKDVLVTNTDSEGVYWGNQPGGAAGLPVSQTAGLTAVSPGGVTVGTGQPVFPLGINAGAVPFASLPTPLPPAGTMIYCTNCTVSALCSTGVGGSGHWAVSNGTNWTCQ
jgi:hypothetical protein